MATCKTCLHPQRRELERQAKAGVPASTLAEWSRSQTGGYVSRLAIGNHLRKHLGVTGTVGRREMSGDLAQDIVARVTERVADGELEPGVADGLKAQAILDKRLAQKLGSEWQMKLVLALGGHSPQKVRVLDAMDLERLEQEAEFRPLLNAGQES